VSGFVGPQLSDEEERWRRNRVRNRVWRQVEETLDLLDGLDEDHLTVLMASVLNTAADRAGDEGDPWVNVRKRMLRGVVALAWAELHPGRGRIEHHRGSYKIFLRLDLTWTEMREVLMHELVHLETASCSRRVPRRT
jgi:hypothetical protein